MKTELELVKELKDEFDLHYTTALNIVEQPNVSPVNALYFTRQKEWCEELAHKFTKHHEKLKAEKLEHRIVRAMGSTENPENFEKAIQALIKERDHCIRKAEEEAQRKQAETEKKQRELEKKQEQLETGNIGKKRKKKLSSCCDASYRAEGDETMFYVCDKCNQACDVQ